MTTVVISCCSMKRDTRCTAEEMYISPLFKKSLKYAKLLKPKHIVILSAKYGVLHLNSVIDPYDLKLSDLSTCGYYNWCDVVNNKLKDMDSDFIVLAGDVYCRGLKVKYSNPLKGLSIGNRLKRLNELCNSIQHIPAQQTQSIVK